ncbi:MAG: sigma-70 family RNA polymerase sigma factor [Chloroherpetonaceae bacterium]
MNTNFENMSDQELLQVFKDKTDASIKAFEELYRRYSQTLYIYFYKFLKNSFFIKDLYQDLFIKIYQLGTEGKLDNVENFRGYVFRMAHNIALNKIYADEKQQTYLEGYKELMEEAYAGAEGSQDEKIEKLRNAIDQLPAHLKEILILREYNHMSYIEISQVTEESMENVKIKIFRAKKKLKQILSGKSKKIRKMV